MRIGPLENGFTMRLHQGVAFRWPLHPAVGGGSLGLGAKAPPIEPLGLPKEPGRGVPGSKMAAPDVNGCNGSLVYAAARPDVTPAEAIEVERAVRGLTGRSARHRASHLMGLWREHGRCRGLPRAVRDFRLFFGSK